MKYRFVMTFAAAIPTIAAVAQFPERDTLENLNTIRSSTIKYEVMSLIPWVWEYYGKKEKPPMHVMVRVPVCENEVRFEGEAVRVVLGPLPFDSAAVRIGYQNSDRYRYTCSINNNAFWGTDGGLPTRMLREPSVTIDGSAVRIPRSAWSDLYQPNLCFTAGNGEGYCACGVSRSMDRKRVYVHMSNSDGAGGYHVTWIFINGRYVRRVLEGPP